MLSHPPSGRVPLRGFTGRPTSSVTTSSCVALEVFYTRQSHLTITRLTSEPPARTFPSWRPRPPPTQWTNTKIGPRLLCVVSQPQGRSPSVAHFNEKIYLW